MIDIQEASKSIGSVVVYKAHPRSEPEEGYITSTSKSYVFVQFAGDRARKACRPEDLEWE